MMEALFIEGIGMGPNETKLTGPPRWRSPKMKA
jgi:hypothetical protein